MSKPILFFPHDTNSRNDQRLQKLAMLEGMRGIGIYWCLIEMLHENCGHIELKELERITYELHEEYKRITSVINDYDLFQKNETEFWSLRVNNNISDIMEKSNKARKAIEIRWKYKRNTDVSKNDTNVIPVEETRVKKTKEDNITVSAFPFENFWNLYDKKTGKEKCELKWAKLNEEEKQTVMLRLPAYITATPERKYRKDPITWLNGKCWNDDYIPEKKINEYDIEYIKTQVT